MIFVLLFVLDFDILLLTTKVFSCPNAIFYGSLIIASQERLCMFQEEEKVTKVFYDTVLRITLWLCCTWIGFQTSPAKLHSQVEGSPSLKRLLPHPHWQHSHRKGPTDPIVVIEAKVYWNSHTKKEKCQESGVFKKRNCPSSVTR